MHDWGSRLTLATKRPTLPLAVTSPPPTARQNQSRLTGGTVLCLAWVASELCYR